jgi:hypothetical protein
MEQSAARSPPSSRIEHRLIQRAINDSGATARISREPLEQKVQISSLPTWSSMPVPSRSASPCRKPEQKPHHRCTLGDPMLRHNGALTFAS